MPCAKLLHVIESFFVHICELGWMRTMGIKAFQELHTHGSSICIETIEHTRIGRSGLRA